MKYLKYILLLFIFNSPVNSQDFTVNFNSSNMFGISTEKIQFNNITLGLPIPQAEVVQSTNAQSTEYLEPTLEPTNVTYEEVPYNTYFKICRYDSGKLYLLPQLTPEEPNCKIAEGMDLSNSYGIILEPDRVQINNISYNDIAHDIIFKFDLEKIQFEQDDEIIVLPIAAPNYLSIMLEWDNELPDLDAHLTGPIAPHSVERFHLYFADMFNNGDVAVLNVGYDEFETKPEMITLLPPIINFETQERGVTLRPGFYQFTVQHFYGNGTLFDSNAVVHLKIGDGPDRRFELPYYEGAELLGEMDIWIVFKLEILENGLVITDDSIQRYELGISPHEIK